ncbi:hypothetical protein H8U31_001263 [Salmonella enterica]|nr:hypothetical protein [Salmonella enterica]EFO7976557.1 hypothetical protein [Salmonella enterica]EGC0267513.1 hypothetical protein [Salmonella enterica]
MNITTFISHYFGGNRQAFRDAVGVSTNTVYRWMNLGAVVAHGKICLPSQDAPAVPTIAPPDRREDFERAYQRVTRDADLSRVGEHYVCPNAQSAWQGWQLAQQLFTAEALNG